MVDASTAKTHAANLRHAGRGDEAKLARIGVETFVEAFGEFYSDQDLQAFLTTNHGEEVYRELLHDPEFTLWLAEDGRGDPVGYCVTGPCGLPVDPMPEKAGELKRLYVLAAYQSGGIGSKMLEQALVQMHDQFDHLYISVYAENFGAKRLYERHGFEVIGHYEFMVGNHADPELMMKWVG